MFFGWILGDREMTAQVVVDTQLSLHASQTLPGSSSFLSFLNHVHSAIPEVSGQRIRRILLQKKRTAPLYANMRERKRDDTVRSAVFGEVPIPISSSFRNVHLDEFRPSE
jgi:hypothetical protein